jgi:ssRNA-specific RNase YbeY (16S rRNA maturation enzyme)
MDPTISVESTADHLAFDPLELERLVAPLLRGNVEIVLSDPGCMRVLNRRFRRIDRSADVLTFDLSEGGDAPEGVVYVDARLYPPIAEIVERVFHGYLHLMGWTHDTPEDDARMRAEVERMTGLAMKARGS